MTPEIMVIPAFIAFGIFLAAGMSIPFAITVPSLLYLYFQGGVVSIRAVSFVGWGSLNSFVLVAVPMFILMAEIIQKSGMIAGVYRGLSHFASRIPGGLFQTNIVGSAVFSSISGSSITTAVLIGGMAMPELNKRAYNSRLATGSLAAGGTLGILIPPSLAMIIYSTLTETSVARLFMAGVLPGLMLTILFVILIAVICAIWPDKAPREVVTMTLKSVATALVDLIPLLVLVAIVLGSIYLGIATPTEAAAIGCLGGIVLAAIFGTLNWRIINEALNHTIRVSGSILFIVMAAYLFAYAISYGGAGEAIVNYVMSWELSRLEFLLVIFIMYLVLGCFVESIGMIVLTVPLLFPILLEYDIDPIWFGVILVIFIEIGQVTPPLGINLFVVQSISGHRLADVIIGVIPFWLCMLLMVMLLTVWPQIALYLPSLMIG